MVVLETHEQVKAFLEERKARLRDVQTRGIEALSSFDRQIAYSGDEALALRETLRLIENHIAYATQKLAEFGPEQSKLFES